MKKDKSPNYIRVGIFTIVTTLCWIIFSAYRILTASPAPSLSEQVLSSFSPVLDLSKIDEIQGRIFFEEGQTQPVLDQTPTPSPTPLEEIVIEETPTASPTPTDGTEEATTSGEVTQ